MRPNVVAAPVLTAGVLVIGNGATAETLADRVVGITDGDTLTVLWNGSKSKV